jgi:hypothetical protein
MEIAARFGKIWRRERDSDVTEHIYGQDHDLIAPKFFERKATIFLVNSKARIRFAQTKEPFWLTR